MARDTETRIQGNKLARQAELLAGADTLCDFGSSTVVASGVLPDCYVVDALDTALAMACDAAISARNWTMAQRYARALDFGSTAAVTAA